MTTLNFTQAIPLSLYIHIPWCMRKCLYCDFNSHARPEVLPEQAYVQALIADLDEMLPLVWGRSLQTIFIGGGTPSLFSGQAMEQILQAVSERFRHHPQLEITLEANPGTVEQANFAGYVAAGVNRLSLGVQSFNDHALKSLGRVHDHRQALTAIECAQNSGFAEINIDLMHGLPQQTPAQALADLTQSIACGVNHISWYQLTIEPNTYFYRYPPAVPSDDEIATLQQQGRELLTAAGFMQYEISAYARDQRHCQHNINYWQFGDYLGIGAGAHSKITDVANAKVTRLWKVRQPDLYLNSAKPFTAGEKTIAADDLIFEFMLNHCRLPTMITWQCFEERTGLSRECISKPIHEAQALGLLAINEQGIKLTDLGWRFVDDVVKLFMVAD